MTPDLNFHEQLAVAKVPCRDKTNDPNWWFGDSEDPDEKYNNKEAHRAAELCGDCPLRLECLSHALANGERYGVWGATSPHTRERMRKHGAL